MPGAAYPKPDSQRQRRNAPTFDWVKLPASGNPNPAPPMPPGNWHEGTQHWWRVHWSHPCATQWRTDDPAHERLALLHEGRWRYNVIPNGPTLSEMRQLEDRLGLTPKARLQLRWLILDDDGNPTDQPLAVVREMPKNERKRSDPRQ